MYVLNKSLCFSLSEKLGTIFLFLLKTVCFLCLASLDKSKRIDYKANHSWIIAPFVSDLPSTSIMKPSRRLSWILPIWNDRMIVNPHSSLFLFSISYHLRHSASPRIKQCLLFLGIPWLTKMFLFSVSENSLFKSIWVPVRHFTWCYGECRDE